MYNASDFGFSIEGQLPGSDMLPPLTAPDAKIYPGCLGDIPVVRAKIPTPHTLAFNGYTVKVSTRLLDKLQDQLLVVRLKSNFHPKAGKSKAVLELIEQSVQIEGMTDFARRNEHAYRFDLP